MSSHQKWFCPACQRKFKCSRHFRLHPSQNKNIHCNAFCESNPATAPVGVHVVPQERNQEEPDVLPGLRGRNEAEAEEEAVNPVNVSVDALNMTMDGPDLRKIYPSLMDTGETHP